MHFKTMATAANMLLLSLVPTTVAYNWTLVQPTTNEIWVLNSSTVSVLWTIDNNATGVNYMEIELMNQDWPDWRLSLAQNYSILAEGLTLIPNPKLTTGGYYYIRTYPTAQLSDPNFQANWYIYSNTFTINTVDQVITAHDPATAYPNITSTATATATSTLSSTPTNAAGSLKAANFVVVAALFFAALAHVL